MKILFALDKFRWGTGGAVFSAQGIARALSEAGHRVRVAEVGPKNGLGAGRPLPPDVEIAAYPLTHFMGIRDGHFNLFHWTRLWRPIIDREIRDFEPDLVLTQNVLAPASVAAARAAGVPSVLFFRGYDCLAPDFFFGKDALTNGCPGFGSVTLRRKLKWPLIRRAMAAYRAAYREAGAVVANSEYTARVIERYFEREARVLYPVLDMAGSDPGDMGSREGDILMIKPSRVKGAEILREIALGSPDRTFSVAGRVSKRLRRLLSGLPNLELRGWISDREELYRGASLLLGPARIPEPFGRIFVEAGRRGIPSVASRSGGIVEAVGGGGVLVAPEAGPAAWNVALERALRPDNYDLLSREAHRHAHGLIEEHGSARLLNVIA